MAPRLGRFQELRFPHGRDRPICEATVRSFARSAAPGFTSGRPRITASGKRADRREVASAKAECRNGFGVRQSSFEIHLSGGRACSTSLENNK